MTIKEEILSNFGDDLDKRIVDYLDLVLEALAESKTKVTSYTKMILIMLVSQLILYYKSRDEILASNEVSGEDSYKRKSKLPSISIYQTANDKILTLLDKISISPLAAAKVNKLNERSGDQNEAPEIFRKLINQA